jgi:hypothetical protein
MVNDPANIRICRKAASSKLPRDVAPPFQFFVRGLVIGLRRYGAGLWSCDSGNLLRGGLVSCALAMQRWCGPQR